MPKPDLSRLDGLYLGSLDIKKNTKLSTEQELNFTDDAQMTDNLHEQLDNTVLRLSDYLAAVDLVIKETFSHQVWVKAEIRNLSSKGGHYYFELAEKDDSGKVIASCRGNLWRYKAQQVLTKFERCTGMPLARDLMVLLNVKASFHAQYGFSLVINDIDPTYTVGDLARQYAAIVERLAGEGLLQQNKQCPTPFDIEHVLVIAPEQAAGLGDFRADADRLNKNNACQFHYHHATFQGNHAPKEIRHAISHGMQSFQKQYNRLPDLMVIIRGGGAVGDLAYLNDYELGALVAEQPIPVWVGIGHERDRVILDEVAHTSFDTPSKVIAAIINHLTNIMQQAQSFGILIKQLSQQQLQQASNKSDRYFLSIKNYSQHNLLSWQKDSHHAITQVRSHAHYQLRQINQETRQHLSQIQLQSKRQLQQAREDSKAYLQSIRTQSYRQIEATNVSLQHYQQLILIQHPARLLQQGYTLLKDEKTDKTITKMQQLSVNQSVHIHLQDGKATARITALEPQDNESINT